MNRSMIDVAFDLLGKRKKPLSFTALWQGVCKTMEFNDTQAANKIANFYSTLMLDTRFAALEDNQWDLRCRRTYEETHPDTSDLVIEDDQDDLDEEFSEESEEKPAEKILFVKTADDSYDD